MTLSLEDRFNALTRDELGKFHRVETPRSAYRDVSALQLLAELSPNNDWPVMMSSVLGDKVVFNVESDLTGISDDMIRELLRHGVRYSEVVGFYMTI